MMVLIRYFIFSVVINYITTQDILMAEGALHDHLLANYKPDIRPRNCYYEPTLIGFDFYLGYLKEYDEKIGQLSVSGYMKFMWHDRRLQWNTTEYVLHHTNLRVDRVWTPPIQFVNHASNPKSLNSENPSDIVSVKYDGTVQWITSVSIDAFSPAHVTFFPFDTQVCDLYFRPGAYLKADVYVNPSNSVNLDYYQPSGIWDILSTHGSDPYDYVGSLAKFTIVIKRRPSFYLITIFMPIYVLGFLNIFVFLIPSTSGERIGFSVTVLLAIAVFMTLVMGILPETTEPTLSISSYVLFSDTAISGIILFFVIFSLRYHHKCTSDETVNAFHRYQVFLSRRLLCKSRKHIDLQSTLLKDAVSVECVNDKFNKYSNTNPCSNKMHVPCLYDEQVKNGDAHGKIEWIDVANAFDMINFIIFLLLFVIRIVAVVLIYYPHG